MLTVNNMDAGQLVRILRPLVPKGGHLAAAAQSNSLVIADTAANVRRIKSLISRIDRESMEDFEVLPLQHASALDVVRIVQGLDSNAPAEEFARGPKLIADERTNSVILRGDPEARAGPARRGSSVGCGWQPGQHPGALFALRQSRGGGRGIARHRRGARAQQQQWLGG
ncbi:secretin N-terminal domain-containing protein [Halopseudomonas pachastrellae]|nr:secretin N-terminal domain-containing protein [Halopseudomonas pachastrellae]